MNGGDRLTILITLVTRKKNAFLCGLVHQAALQRGHPRTGSKGNNNYTNTFHFQNNDCTITVSKIYFFNTFL